MTDINVEREKSWFEKEIERLKYDEVFMTEGLVLDISDTIAREVYDKKTISKKKIDKLMGKKRGFTKKILRGNDKLKLKTMVKLLKVLGYQLKFDIQPIEENMKTVE